MLLLLQATTEAREHGGRWLRVTRQSEWAEDAAKCGRLHCYGHPTLFIETRLLHDINSGPSRPCRSNSKARKCAVTLFNNPQNLFSQRKIEIYQQTLYCEARVPQWTGELGSQGQYAPGKCKMVVQEHPSGNSKWRNRITSLWPRHSHGNQCLPREILCSGLCPWGYNQNQEEESSGSTTQRSCKSREIHCKILKIHTAPHIYNCALWCCQCPLLDTRGLCDFVCQCPADPDWNDGMHLGLLNGTLTVPCSLCWMSLLPHMLTCCHFPFVGGLLLTCDMVLLGLEPQL